MVSGKQLNLTQRFKFSVCNEANPPMASDKLFKLLKALKSKNCSLTELPMVSSKQVNLP
jgi:hypothetical protein